ncbi:TetR/AcrR family transcriptional regulator [Dinghuibacter silviterrae]|uniref:TetR family transcriptional regulator n=1 Tax=Dinghuibacter silviterrae TaxID=1539049 RepID=A0A4R8DTH8_9BACT|nr:TetR/AcrR family transcriptional regulator [Dinghuibacter silviterrae]TDX01612.1 TetR family transcriptional regulator [Dinghuibacter silviterrae]
MKTRHGPRERIVAAAYRLFYEQGYGATGINQIIEEASVAKASLYQLFRSKDELLLEYLKQRDHEWWTEFDAFRAGIPEGRKMLLALFDYRLKLVLEHRYRGCSFKRIAYELPDLDGPAAAVIREHKLGVKAFIATHLKIHNPSLSRQETADLTEFVMDLFEGSGNQTYLLRNTKPVEDAKRLLQKFIP